MKIKNTFIYAFSVFLVLSAHADENYLNNKAKSVVDSIDYYLRAKKNYPKQDSSRNLRKAQRDALQFNNTLVYGDKGTPTDQSIRLNAEADIDYYADECARNKKLTTICKASTDQLAAYKAKYNADYKPKTPAYPEIDLEKYTYSLNGKTYDLKNRKYVTATAETPKASTPVAKTTVSTPVTVSAVTSVSATATTSETAKESKGYEYTCEWDNALPPRKLLYAPGCSGSGKVCSGFVKCTKNGFKINRLATCGAEFCTDATPTECAKQRGYGSKTVTADGQAVPHSKSSDPQNNGKGVN